ncbi:MAG: tetratricopeptide repeat protein [Candidatus Obscuribacterales bacterium]|nr:tetratricopeptide repeat protein [Cyanobacteria bacterium HKST-UBA01]MCB9468553.1 tetratricopeptide repeat protein [Candidatus Obscuribacterales bacterium]
MKNVMQLVNELVSQDRWDEAYSVLTRHAQQNRNDHEVNLGLGVLCFNMGRYEEAERYLKLALELQPSSPEIHYQLGLCLLKQDRPKDAMPEFRSACELKSDFAVGHLHWGLALAAMGSLRGALGQFRQAIKYNPNMAAAHYQAGIASFQMEQYEESAQCFQNAANVDPKLAEAYNGVGTAFCAQGRFEEALSCFEMAVANDSQYFLAHRNWAAALVHLNRLDEALTHYQEAIKLAPETMTAKDRALIYNDWGANLFRQNKLEESSEKFFQAVDVDPTMEPARLNLGLVYMAMKEYESAADVFEKGLQINYANIDMGMYCSVNYLLLGRFDEAFEKLNRLSGMGMDHPDLHLWLGYAHLGAGRTQPAEKCFERALQINPDNYLALDGWGCAYALAGNQPAAVEKFKQCIAVNDRYGLGHLHLSRSLDALGDLDTSRHEFKEAVVRDPLCIIPQKESMERLLEAHQFEVVMQQSMRMLDILPHDVDAKLSLARALKEQNRTNEALHLVLELINEKPDNGPARVIAGQIYLAKGRFAEADEMFLAASQLFEGDSGLFFAWGRTLAALGLHEMALEKYEKASEIDPYDGDTYEAWGATLKALGRFSEAAEVYKRAAQYI